MRAPSCLASCANINLAIVNTISVIKNKTRPSEMSEDTIAPAVDALIFALEHDFDEDVRGYAARALGNSGEARAV